MPFPLIAYGVIAAVAAGIGYIASDDEDEKKPKLSSDTKNKSRVNPSSSTYYKRGERKRRMAIFDKEVSEYVKKEKIRLANKHAVNKQCLIQKGRYRVELHADELFKANTKARVNRLKNEISEIDDTILKLKEWRGKHA